MNAIWQTKKRYIVRVLVSENMKEKQIHRGALLIKRVELFSLNIHMLILKAKKTLEKYIHYVHEVLYVIKKGVAS